VANALDALTGSQRDAVTQRPSPLLIDGAPGAGKTTVLVRRVCWLAEQGLAAQRPLVIARDQHAVGAMTAAIEAVLAAPHEDLSVYTTRGLCASLIDERSAAAGVEQMTPVVSAGERLALLLESVEQLELRHHDFRGRPLTLFAAFVRRIDQLKAELIDAERYADLARAGSELDREFAAVFRVHERLLRERGVLDAGDQLILCVRMLERDATLAEGLAERHQHLLVDDWQIRSPGERRLIALLAQAGASLTVAGDDVEARLRGGEATVERLAQEHPGAQVIRLAESVRCPEAVVAAALAVAAEPAQPEGARAGVAGATVSFWRCASSRAQAQHVAAQLERLITRDGTAPERCAVLVGSVAGDGPAIAEALSERGIEHHVLGAGWFFERTEVRDVLAWLRLLVDPRDAAAVVRALSRPPIELHAVDIARCVQLARRRKLDMVAGLAVALESPQLAPEARERVAAFLQIQRASAAAFDEERADLFVYRLIERLGLRRHQLFSARSDVAERLVNLAKLGDLAALHARAVPGATPREFAIYAAAVAESGLGDAELIAIEPERSVVVAGAADVGGREFDQVFVLDVSGRHAVAGPALYVAMTRARQALVFSGVGDPPAAAAESARAALGGAWEQREEELFGPSDALHALFGERRDELLDSIARVGARLGELRFDTDLDVTHAMVRLLELIKLAALLERREEQPVADALADVNARLAAAATPLQREILLSSPLDELLAGAERTAWRAGAARPAAAHEEPSLEHFLPRRGDRLVLSASDVDTYRACPLRYKFARVLRIPREPTLNQRFGIVVHQVLERYHEQLGSASAPAPAIAGEGGATMMRLLEIAWRRGGFGDSGEERQLRDKARAALLRYEERLSAPGGTAGTPRWFERSFTFPLGAHLVRGRVDRIDELPGGGYELIDYKTSLPRRAEQLREDVQLGLYALAARETWQLEASERTYYYVLDDQRVSLGPEESDPAWITQTVERAGEGILAQAFEPTPSRAVCAMCDYRITCPAAER
jgi:DNA helicase-2/ATP-dependent DNA helicase PcrA